MSQSAGLRQRPGKGSDAPDPTVREEYLKTAAMHAPISVQPYLLKIVPVIVIFWGLIESCIPHLIQAKEKWDQIYKKLEPYHPDDLVPCFIGLAMVFFGGDFPMLIATVSVADSTRSSSLLPSRPHAPMPLEIKFRAKGAPLFNWNRVCFLLSVWPFLTHRWWPSRRRGRTTRSRTRG